MVLAGDVFAGEIRFLVRSWEDILGSDFFSIDSALLYLLLLGVTCCEIFTLESTLK